MGGSFDDEIMTALEPYFGIARDELKERLGVQSEAKNANELLLRRMLHVRGRISNDRRFQAAGIRARTVRVRADGRVRESLPFPSFDPIRLDREEGWEMSELYGQLRCRFLFALFWDDMLGRSVFRRAVFWTMPEADQRQAARVWERTRNTLRMGIREGWSVDKILSLFPKKNESPVAHVRPHARDAADVCQIPDGRWMTKQSFWLNNDYIARRIGGTP